MTEISVIIPAFNRAHTLVRALDSVLAQTHRVKEIIIVDDGSSDDTLKLLEHGYPQVTVLSQGNRGVSAARNVGIKAATTDWIALLDSDDEWLSGKLEAQVRALQAQPDKRLCHS
ncbi:MAG: glycosyltransferase family 2 protein, partial [Gammaproteobacteria bacterium]|nr:glycosyltransferase family 2 protein [Gammaproteobacteria bacterium]